MQALFVRDLFNSLLFNLLVSVGWPLHARSRKDNRQSTSVRPCFEFFASDRVCIHQYPSAIPTCAETDASSAWVAEWDEVSGIYSNLYFWKRLKVLPGSD